MMKNVVVATMKITGTEMAMRRKMNLITRQLLIVGVLPPVMINPNPAQVEFANRVGYEIPHVWFQQDVAGIGINRKHGGFTKQKLLGLLEKFHSLGWISFLAGERKQVIVIWIFPSGIVIAVGAFEKVHERARVRIVGDPGVAGDVVILCPAALQKRRPFHVVNGDVNIQVPGPHLLHRFGHSLVILV